MVPASEYFRLKFAMICYKMTDLIGAWDSNRFCSVTDLSMCKIIVNPLTGHADT